MIDKWFSTIFDYDICNNINTQELIELSYKVFELSEGRTTTNVNSWQSNDLDLSLPVLQPLLKEVHNKFELLHEQYGFKKNLMPAIDNLWINIYPHGGTTQAHIHSDNIFSGVFFIKTPENSGQLVFPHPAANFNYHFYKSVLDDYNQNNSSFCKHLPQKNKMIVFPSYALHYVEPNLSYEDRISIAFNSKIVKRSPEDKK